MTYGQVVDLQNHLVGGVAANAIGALAGIVLSGMLTRKMRKKA